MGLVCYYRIITVFFNFDFIQKLGNLKVEKKFKNLNGVKI